MQENRREFLKKAAIVASGVATTQAMGASLSLKNDLADKVKNTSGKKEEILYKRTPAWDLFYKQSK